MKKYIVATVMALAVFAVGAFAASLDVNAGTLQAGEGSILPCITDDVVVKYDEPAFTNPGWTVAGITLDHGGDCDGLAYSVTITGTSGSTPFQTSVETGTFDANPEPVEFDAPFDAEGAGDVHLVLRSAS